MNQGIESPAPARKLMTCEEVAEFLGCTQRSVYRLSDSGQLPQPLKVGGLSRWSREVIDEWISAGCPRVRHTAAKSRKRGE